MAYNKFGFKTLTDIGTLDGTGVPKALHAYVTNDAESVVAASGYFNTIAGRINTGDLVMCSLDNDGTPEARTYVLINTAGVITTSLAVATADA